MSMAQSGPVLSSHHSSSPRQPLRHPQHQSVWNNTHSTASGSGVSSTNSESGEGKPTRVVVPSPQLAGGGDATDENPPVPLTLNISTASQHSHYTSTTSTSSTKDTSGNVFGYVNVTGDVPSPSSVQTTSSYRSPTKWTNFEDEEDSDAYSADTEPHSPSNFHRMDSVGSGAPLTVGTAASSDTETKNLIDDVMSESDAQSLFEGTEDPLVMTDDQRLYYLNCFKDLQKNTQGEVDLHGAVQGSEKNVQEFFHKSKLDRDTLRKIWELSDVNKDGWLNLEEFSISMHLIVLHVKGNYQVPEYLPPHVAPPMTPPRGEDGAKGVWQDFGDQSPKSRKSSQGSRISAQPQVSPSPKNKEFTNLPPSSGMELQKPVPMKMSPEAEMILTVTDSPDGKVHLHQRPALQSTSGDSNAAPKPPRRRTQTMDAPSSSNSVGTSSPPPHALYNVPSSPSAVPLSVQKKAATLPMSPSVPNAPYPPKGPPPKPPPRPPHKAKGHVRSASLDLGGNSQQKQQPAPDSGKQQPPPVASRHDHHGHPTLHNQHQQEMYGHHERSVGGGGQHGPPPSIPPEGAVPPLPLPLPLLQEVQTQTEDADFADVGLTRNRHSLVPPMLDLEEDDDAESSGKEDAGRSGRMRRGKAFSPDEPSTPGISGPVDFKTRVDKLKKIVGELDRERAKLGETRLQLEIQLHGLKSQKK